MRVFLLFFAIFTFLAWSATARALEIVPGGDEGLNCVATLKGQFVKGDTERVYAFLKSAITDDPETSFRGLRKSDPINLRLCLDSPGGSIIEALRMADMLLNDTEDSWKHFWIGQTGTAVAEGAVCESACAIFFMAGGYNAETAQGRVPNRVLHVGGKLGFHSIDLHLNRQSYSKEEVSQIFALSILGMSEIADRMKPHRIRLSLLRTMLRTPPDQMHYVTTVGEAAQWNIEIAGLPVLRSFSRDNIKLACEKMFAQYYSEDGIQPTNYGYERTRLGHPRFTMVTGGGFVVYEQQDTDLRFSLSFANETGDIGCEGFVDLATLRAGAETLNSSGYILDLPNYWMFPPNTDFPTLLDLADDKEELPPDAILETRENFKSGTCFVFQAGSLLDKEPCREISTTQRLANAATREVARYVWPSGSVTVVETLNEHLQINGAAATVGDVSDLLGHFGATCVRNSASGNTFCFEER